MLQCLKPPKKYMKIDTIIVHHSGGLGDDIYAKTQNLSLEHIDNAHKARWPGFRSALGYWVGYTAVIFPDGKMVQTRLIGEETAHTKGHNKHSVGIFLFGNFTKIGSLFVEKPTEQQVKKLKEVGVALLNHRPQDVGLEVAPGTQLDFSVKRIGPHRLYGWTKCYGTYLADNWARTLIQDGYYEQRKSEYQEPTSKKIVELQKQIMSMQVVVIELAQKLVALLQQKRLAGVEGSCIEEDLRG